MSSSRDGPIGLALLSQYSCSGNSFAEIRSPCVAFQQNVPIHPKLYLGVCCMRPASQRLLRNISALGALCNTYKPPLTLYYSPKLLCGRRADDYGSRATSSSGTFAETSPVDHDTKASRRSIRKRLGLIRKHDNRTKLLAVIRKIANRGRVEDWRQYLVTFERWQYESDLDNSDPNGSYPRLVDSPKYAMDFDLWLELVRFRQRHYGLEGLITIWKNLSGRGLQLPCGGRIADELWSALLELGFNFPEILKEIEVYAKKQRALTGQSWPKLYLTILRYHLRFKPNYAYEWHAHLHIDFPPSPEHVVELFRHALMNEAALGYFRRIYIGLGMRHMYNTIIPEFCARGDFTAALKWHNLLIRKCDLPSNASISEPLLHHLAIYGNHDHLVEITKRMVDAGVSFADRTRSNLKPAPLISRVLMNRQLGEIHGISPKVLTDGFCARLFATTMFTIDIVINGLCVLGVEAIGPLSLKELASREKSIPEAINSRIDQLSRAGISIGNSTFSKLVRKLASEGKSTLLNDVLACDLHPDTFEDRNLLESLFLSYHQAGDTRQMERTLAILTVNSTHESLAADYLNLLLRLYLTRRDLNGIKLTLDKMRDMHLMVSPRSSSYVRVCMLSRRQVGRRPYRTDDLPLVINIWQQLLQLGGTVPPIAWREILKRLGIAGQLMDFEALSLWLAKWYSDPTARASHLSLASSEMEDRKVSTPRVLAILSPRHHLHPLRSLFPTVMQEAIVTWGFQRGVNGKILRDTSSTGRTRRLPWTWGLQLLRKLSQCKVHVARQTVARICRQRLVSLFGCGLSNRKINRRAQQVNKHYLSHYANEIREIWGADLFDEAYLLPAKSRYRRSVLEHGTTSKRMAPQITRPTNEPTHKIT
jgi:hypothetical protein